MIEMIGFTFLMTCIVIFIMVAFLVIYKRFVNKKIDGRFIIEEIDGKPRVTIDMNDGFDLNKVKTYDILKFKVYTKEAIADVEVNQ